MKTPFLRCSCGRYQSARKMRSVGGELLCPKCAAAEQTRLKRMARHADDYIAVVVLLDGTRLWYGRRTV